MTGLFFGSYNPIHTGHLIIAEFIGTAEKLNEIWFIVSPQNPLKDPALLVSKELRLEMVKGSVKGNKKFRASNIEFGLPQPSFTIDTLKLLSKKYPRKKFALILGSDSLQSIHQWKEGEAIISDYHVIVYPRAELSESLKKRFPEVSFINAPLLQISSTLVRKRVAEKKSIRYLVPEEVRKIIVKEKLYKAPR